LQTTSIRKQLDGSLGATGSQTTDNQINAAVKRARNSATGMDVKDVDKVMDNYTESKDFKDLAASNRSEADKISASMSQAKSLRTSASSAFRQSDDYRQTAENLKSAALRGEIDWTPEFNRFLKDRGTLGVTGDEAVAEANAFFKQTGVGVGADGTPKAVLYGKQGGPSAVTVTPGSYRDPQRLQQAAQEASLMANGQSATASGMDQQNRANRQTVTARGTGTSTAPTDGQVLKEQYDGERQHAQTRVNAGRAEAQKEQKAIGNDYLTALDGSSPTHVLGNQGNDMSGAQQVKTDAKALSKEHRTSEGTIRPRPTK
jgi:hypothetical protein